MAETTIRSIRIDESSWDELDRVARENGETRTSVIRRLIATYIRAGGVLAAVLAALFTISACGGAEPDAQADARESVAAQIEADKQAEIDAKVRAQSGECTPTGPGSEFRALGDVVPQEVAALEDWLDWLESAPEGCTDRDKKWLSEAVKGVEATIDVVQSQG